MGKAMKIGYGRRGGWRAAASGILVGCVALLFGCGGPTKAEIRDRILKQDLREQTAAYDKREFQELTRITRQNPHLVIDLYRTDPDATVRRSCAMFLRQAKCAMAATALAQGAEHEADGSVRVLSMLMLEGLVKDFPRNPTVRTAGLAAARFWIKAGKTHHSAVEVIGILGGAEDIPTLEGSCQSGTTQAHLTDVVDAIHAIGGPPAVQALRRIRGKAKDPDLQRHIDDLLKS